MITTPAGAAIPAPLTLGIILGVAVACGIIYYIIKRPKD